MLPIYVIFTGTQVAYYIICPTKLWLFSNFIQQESNSNLVLLGQLLQEISFPNVSKNLIIDQKISIDFIKRGNRLILHEIKRSDKLEKAHKYQLLYYIYYLKKFKGIEVEGIINYPTKRKIVKVELTKEKEMEIEQILYEIKKIVSRTEPPNPIYKPYCKKCSYYEFCFS